MPFWDPPTKDGLTFMLEPWCLITEVVTVGQCTYTHWHCWQEDGDYHWHQKPSLLLSLVYEACKRCWELWAALVLSWLCFVLDTHVLSSHTLFSGLLFSWVFAWSSQSIFYLLSHFVLNSSAPGSHGTPTLYRPSFVFTMLFQNSEHTSSWLSSPQSSTPKTSREYSFS